VILSVVLCAFLACTVVEVVGSTEDEGTMLEKSIKQLNRVSIWVRLWSGLGLVLGLVPSSELVL